MGFYRFRDTFQVQGPERSNHYIALDKPQRPRGHVNRPGRRDLLHTGRQVRRQTHGGVIHMEIAPDRAHDDLARINPDSYLERDAVRSKNLAGMGFNYLLHSERGVAGADRVILKRERCSEKRHNTVAHYLVDRAFVTVHSLHHPLENGVEKPARVVGIQVDDVLRRAFQVGEEDRKLLSFTLQCRLG